MINDTPQKKKTAGHYQNYFGFLSGGQNGTAVLARVRRSKRERDGVTRLFNRSRTELVVLVDKQNNEIGTAPKEMVHTTNTSLHRGFSLFLFNSKKEVLLTKRAKTKKTFPDVWTNTVCGHPAPQESVVDAARRRLKDELRIDLSLKRSHLVKKQGETLIQEVAPYRYRFADKNGIVENEICPVLVAYSDADPKPDPKEVEEWKWMKWEEFLEDLKKNPERYSPWCREETKLVKNNF